MQLDRPAVTEALAAAGCIAPAEEAAELIAAAGGEAGVLEELLARRCTGEPIAWLTGSTRFCGIDLHVEPGAYVPRWQTEPLARRAAALLPAGGIGVDLCTGVGPDRRHDAGRGADRAGARDRARRRCRAIRAAQRHRSAGRGPGRPAAGGARGVRRRAGRGRPLCPERSARPAPARRPGLRAATRARRRRRRHGDPREGSAEEPEVAAARRLAAARARRRAGGTDRRAPSRGRIRPSRGVARRGGRPARNLRAR